MSDMEQPPAPGWWKASDGNWYPPQQAPVATPGYPSAVPVAAQGMSGCLKAFIIVAILGVVGFAALIGGVLFLGKSASNKLEQVADEIEAAEARGDFGSASGTDHPAMDDVELGACRDGEFGPTVSVHITNHSSERSNYMVSVNLLDDDGSKIGEGVGFENNLGPGQDAVTEVAASARGEWTQCELVDVFRVASD